MATENIVVKVEQEEFVVVKEETLDLTKESVYDIPKEYSSIKIDCEPLLYVADSVSDDLKQKEARIKSSFIISKGLKTEVVGKISLSNEREDFGQSLGKEDFMNSLPHFPPPVVPSFTMPYLSHAMPWGMHPPSTYLPYPYYQFPMSPFQMHNYPHMFGQVRQPNILLSSTPLLHLNGNQKVTTSTSFRNQETPGHMKYTLNHHHQDLHSNLCMDKRPLTPGKVKKRPHATSIPYTSAGSKQRSVDSPAIRMRPTENNPCSSIPDQPILPAYQHDVSLQTSDPDDSSKINNLTLDSGRPFKCAQCGKGFVKKGYLSMHMQSHMPKVKSHKCKECDKSFEKKYFLSMHMKLHTQKDRPTDHNPCSNIPEQLILPAYQCNLSLHASNPDDSSKIDNLILDYERPYKCAHCNQGFVKKCYLSMHMQSHMPKVRSHKCTGCDKSFVKKCHLSMHMKVHTQKDRPFVCKECGKGFARKGNLTNHIRNHTENKYFECSICDMIFTYKADIKRHFSMHIPEKTGDINYNEL